jgi:hypothetical protein
MSTVCRSIVVCAFLVAACSNDGKPGAPDAPTPDAVASTCGQPGDLGNEKSIGHFCASLGDCSTFPEAPLCSSLGDPTTHFCTKTCRSTDPAGVCGTGAECTCNAGNQCGCTPSVCLTGP